MADIPSTPAGAGAAFSESDEEVAATPSRDRFSRAIILIVVVIWAAGAIAQISMPHSYSEPWWIHVIALCTVSYALTGSFAQSRLLTTLRGAIPALKS